MAGFREQRVGRGVAWIEILAGLAVLAVAAGFVVPALQRARVGAGRETCLANLVAIGRGLGLYIRANGDRWPYVAKLRSFKLHEPPWPTLPEVLTGFLGGDAGVFHCPGDVRELTADDPLAGSFPMRTTWYETEGLSYGWRWSEVRGGEKVGETSLTRATGSGIGPADQELLTDFELFHKGDGGGAYNTLFADFNARMSRAAAGD
jgi:hypothetical protein